MPIPASNLHHHRGAAAPLAYAQPTGLHAKRLGRSMPIPASRPASYEPTNGQSSGLSVGSQKPASPKARPYQLMPIPASNLHHRRGAAAPLAYAQPTGLHAKRLGRSMPIPASRPASYEPTNGQSSGLSVGSQKPASPKARPYQLMPIPASNLHHRRGAAAPLAYAQPLSRSATGGFERHEQRTH